MREEQVQKLAEALEFIRKAESIIKKVQIEISSQLARMETGEQTERRC